ncbi:PQQ-binding-like beta-propeller repeat protein [Micromonospora vulcania]|uniref:PQQ-binding-like beta-propeller repeat protein n=1 Tax=Micromonospora vulcania TaxID=1441873 RepID=A0ABW1HCW9_9ACTN
MDVLIDLGEVRDTQRPDRPRPPPSKGWRITLLVLVCALLGGAAAPARLPGLVGPALPGRAALLSAGALLVVADPGTDPPTLTAYEATAPRRPPRWRVTVPPAAGWSAQAAGDLLLVTERDQVRRVVATTARLASTGQALWRRPGRVYAAGDTVVAVTEVRSVSEPGRRIEGAVHGVDPATGATRWSVPVPSTAVLEVPPGSSGWVLLVQDDGLTRLLDAHDGTLRGQGRLPAANYGPENPQVIGGHLVLRHPGAAGVVLTGYDLPGLAPRWQVPVDPGELALRPCQDLICGQDERSRWALAADTGARVWTWPAGTGWRTLPGGRPGDGTLVLLRPAADGRRQLIATLGRDGPRVRAVLPPEATDCRVRDVGLVCRSDTDRATVWPLGR